MSDLPKAMSVDGHVVEPPHVWQDRLPARMREHGPRVERGKWSELRANAIRMLDLDRV